MPDFVIRNREGAEIRSFDDWRRLAPPKKGDQHWKSGRSALELASAWFRTGVAAIPVELQVLLASHPLTRGFVPDSAIAEKVTRLDNFAGEHRNHDLVVYGTAGHGRIVVTIEAKADESLGQTIDKHLTNSARNPRSKVPARLCLLAQALWGHERLHEIRHLRYQLLTGLAGTLIEAKDCSLAVFIVHEFVSDSTDHRKVQMNQNDLESFIRSFPGMESFLFTPGVMIDGISVKGSIFVPGNIPLVIGKVTTHL